MYTLSSYSTKFSMFESEPGHRKGREILSTSFTVLFISYMQIQRAKSIQLRNFDRFFLIYQKLGIFYYILNKHAFD